MPKQTRQLGTDRPIIDNGVPVPTPEAQPSGKRRPMEEILREQGVLDEAPKLISPAPFPTGEIGAKAHQPQHDHYDRRDISVALIDPSPYQPRLFFDEDKLNSLADAIQAHGGLIRPIIVRPIAGGRYELIGGERRLRAHKILDWEAIRAEVINITDAEAQKIALADNESAEPLSDFERGRAYAELLRESGDSARLLARRLGVSHTTINRCLNFLKLPAAIISLLEKNLELIGTKHIQAFVDLAKDNDAIALKSVQMILEKNISQESALKWARDQINPPRRASVSPVYSGESRLCDLSVKNRTITIHCDRDYDPQKMAAAIQVYLSGEQCQSLRANDPVDDTEPE